MTLDTDAKQAAICKLHLDLWMHQNSLMWSRLQTLGFVQAGFLALAYSLWKDASLKEYALWACLLAILATFGLGIIMWTDRHLRNIHRMSVEMFNLCLYPASTAQRLLGGDKGSSFYEPIFHLLIFLIFIFLDLLSAYVLGLSVSWVIVYGAVFVLIYLYAVVHFYRLAKLLNGSATK